MGAAAQFPARATSMEAPDHSQAADETEFEQMFLDFLAERGEELGTETGGLEAFYLRRLHLRRGLLPNEQAAAHAVLHDLPRYTTYIEVGAGFGQLAWWLAIRGLAVIAVERGPSRFAGLKALQTAIGSKWPEARNRMQAVFDAYPCPLPALEPERSIIVATNFINEADFSREQSIIESIA